MKSTSRHINVDPPAYTADDAKRERKTRQTFICLACVCLWGAGWYAVQLVNDASAQGAG